MPRKDQAPTDHGRRKQRCAKCGAWLCQYHDPTADGGLCWPCAPGGEGVVLEVAPGEFRRFSVKLAESIKRNGGPRRVFARVE